jgi:hypothetical protein
VIPAAMTSGITPIDATQHAQEEVGAAIVENEIANLVDDKAPTLGCRR